MNELRQGEFIANSMGAYAPVKKGGISHRSDAGDLNYADYDKMMRGSGKELRADKRQVTIRNFRDKIRIVETGASLYDQFFNNDVYAYEFRTKRGEFLGGVKKILSDVYRIIAVDVANPHNGIKLSEGALRMQIQSEHPNLDGANLKKAVIAASLPKPSRWENRRISLECVPFGKWGTNWKTGDFRMFFAAQVRDDMKQKCVQAYQGLLTKQARKAAKADRHKAN